MAGPRGSTIRGAAVERPARAERASPSGSRMRVALFVTCLTDTFAPRVGIAVVRVLRHFGCEVVFPERQSCCGQPAYNNGFHAEAAAQARRLIDALDDSAIDYFVTPSGSCATMIIHHVPELLAGDPAFAERARNLARRTHEFGLFLDTVLRVDWGAISAAALGPTTFHYSCHLRALASPERAAVVIAGLGGVDYRPLEQIDQCCGFGGAFFSIFPNISGAMSGQKLDAIAKTGAETVICNESGCGWTLEGLARRRGLHLRFKHLAEVVADALGLMEPSP